MYDEMVTSEQKPIAKIFVKKWVFTPQRLTDMFRDPVALKIIYAQAQTDLKNKLIFPTADERGDLRKLALEGNSKEVCFPSPPHIRRIPVLTAFFAPSFL